jgi:DNA-binding NarL/FixJ family response regulator
MLFEKSFKRMSLPVMTHQERRTTSVLVVDGEMSTRTAMRQTLSALGFPQVSDAPDHIQGLQKLGQRGVTHLIFDAKKTTMPPRDFLAQALEMAPNIIAIPSSYEPNVDDVFTLLVVGARGWLVKPFNEQGLEDSIILASKGEPISESILHARDRNEALAAFIVSATDRLATIMRQGDTFETARREIPARTLALKRAVDIGRTFALGGSDQLLDALMEMCIDRSNGPASRLGRARQRREKKALIQTEVAEVAPTTAPEEPVETPTVVHEEEVR